MDNTAKVVGNNEEGWNVEVAMSGKVVVFACDCRAAAENLQQEISECSWFQIENRTEASQS